MADMDGRNRIPIWVWVVITVILAGVVFYVATRPPPAPERADVAGNEMMVGDPMAPGQPGQPGQPVQPFEPMDPATPEQGEQVDPVTPPEGAVENAQ
jgi:hypothetical protein